jgi:hypothetical protein
MTSRMTEAVSILAEQLFSHDNHAASIKESLQHQASDSADEECRAEATALPHSCDESDEDMTCVPQPITVDVLRASRMAFNRERQQVQRAQRAVHSSSIPTQARRHMVFAASPPSHLSTHPVPAPSKAQCAMQDGEQSFGTESDDATMIPGVHDGQQARHMPASTPANAGPGILSGPSTYRQERPDVADCMPVDCARVRGPMVSSISSAEDCQSECTGALLFSCFPVVTARTCTQAGDANSMRTSAEAALTHIRNSSLPASALVHVTRAAPSDCPPSARHSMQQNIVRADGDATLACTHRSSGSSCSASDTRPSLQDGFKAGIDCSRPNCTALPDDLDPRQQGLEAHHSGSLVLEDSFEDLDAVPCVASPPLQRLQKGAIIVFLELHCQLLRCPPSQPALTRCALTAESV